MNKKFLSAILFGALMVTSTGTFVSCKDYDDDIENLQGQVDATKSDLATKVSALESSISSLQSAQSSLDSKIASTKDAAEKAALEAQKAAIAAAKADLEAAVAELKSAHDADIAEVEAAIATIKGNVEALQAFQGTTEETLEALAAADEKLAGALTELEADVVANATAIGKLEAAIDAQIKALEAYEASNDEAVAANKTAIDAVAADLKKLQDTVAGLKIADPEGLEEAAAAIAEAQGEIAKLSTAVQEINGKLELISSAVYTGVTHISLAEVNNMTESLEFISVKAVTDYVFGANLPGAVTFVKDNVETFEREITFRVSPTNANLDKDMIKIVDTELNSLAGLIDIVELKPYTGQLAAGGGRAISPNGLWSIRLKLKDNFDLAAYDKASYKPYAGYINYALMVNNTAVAERQVVSEYGITLTSGNKCSLYDLGYSVNWKDVSEIKNRWSGAATTETENGGVTSYQEAAWNKAYTKKEIAQTYSYDYAPFITPNWNGFKAGYTNINILKADATVDIIDPCNNKKLIEDGQLSDARSGLLAQRVDAETPFYVQMNDVDNIRAFYVTLDAENAVESAPSELVAWMSYNIKGLNEVVHGSSALEMQVPANAYGDYIGFRVYAVNYDGTLVDPDGKAFYVYVGEQTTVNATLPLVVANKANNDGAHHEALTPWARYHSYATNGWGRAVGGSYTIEFSCDAKDVDSRTAGYQYYVKDENGNLTTHTDNIGSYVGANHFYFVNAYDGKVEIWDHTAYRWDGDKLIGEGKLTADAATLNSIVKVGMNAVKPFALRDGVTYKATITIKGENAQIIGNSTIAFKKELPGFPSNVAPATGMLQNGNVMVFPYLKGTNKTVGTTTYERVMFDMDGAFEGLDNGKIDLLDKTTYGISLYEYTEESAEVMVNKAYVNPNSTSYGQKHSVQYAYNYGAISNVYTAATETWSGVQNWWTTYPFTLQFGNYYQETTMTLTPFTLNYPGAKNKYVAVDLSNIEIRDWYNQVVDLRNAVNNVAETKEARYLRANAVVDFITDNTAKPVNEYFIFDTDDDQCVFAKAQNDATGAFAKYKTVGETFNVYNAEGTKIRSYKLTLADCDVMIVKTQKDAFTGGTVPTKIRITYKDVFGNDIVKTSTNSFTMNFKEQ